MLQFKGCLPAADPPVSTGKISHALGGSVGGNVGRVTLEL